MKIDPTIKNGDLSQAFKEHLGFVDVMNVKSSVVVIILALYDLPLLIGLLSIFKIEFLWILMPGIVILHLVIEIHFKKSQPHRYSLLSTIPLLNT